MDNDQQQQTAAIFATVREALAEIRADLDVIAARVAEPAVQR